jgi:polysaccharide export outer membrane protein
MTRERSTFGTLLRSAALLVASTQLVGCNVDSFFNPSVTGYWEHTPTTIPILERIDAIEPEEDAWGQTTGVTPEDLIPSDLTYRMNPGDYITVQIFELYSPSQWSTVTRRIDPGGTLRVPELGDVPAAGMTAQELEDQLIEMLQDYIINPQVDVVVEEGGGFRYTLYGNVRAPGQYALRNPDLRLIDALSNAGGVPGYTDSVYVIRQIELTEQVKPSFERDRDQADRPPQDGRPDDGGDEPADIDELIDLLDEQDEGAGVSPGVLRQEDEPRIDIDELETAEEPGEAEVDIDRLRERARRAGQEGSWIYVEERGEWVRVPARDGQGPAPATGAPEGEPPMFVERVIEIPYKKLKSGESRYNIVVRPDDRIFVEEPEIGVVYIDGQIVRPGTFNLPVNGKLTLSRLVAAAGGLGQLAIPERVDLVRMVGDNREATIRLNLGAIRQRTEPDVLLKPDDHIIIGTNFWATPLAIIRNGFRATYGFGFLLDRNFGNDVFGAPPTNITGN